MTISVIKDILLVGTGSFFGGATRYTISLLMKNLNKNFPWPTITANLLGCFLIGTLWGYFSRNLSESSNWALILTVGFCGGFTTFSTFSKEALIMLQSGNICNLAAYITISIAAGMALTAFGYYMMQ